MKRLLIFVVSLAMGLALNAAVNHPAIDLDVVHPAYARGVNDACDAMRLVLEDWPDKSNATITAIGDAVCRRLNVERRRK